MNLNFWELRKMRLSIFQVIVDERKCLALTFVSITMFISRKYERCKPKRLKKHSDKQSMHLIHMTFIQTLIHTWLLNLISPKVVVVMTLAKYNNTYYARYIIIWCVSRNIVQQIIPLSLIVSNVSQYYNVSRRWQGELRVAIDVGGAVVHGDEF